MYNKFLEFAVQLAKAAGGIQLAYFRGDRLSIETKSNVYDVVTRADKESEELIAGMIAERYPDHAILGEEGGCRGNAASDWRWVVDPLDGTTNYSQGLPLFTVSIALQYRGETIVGVVYAPYLNELFTATKGGGAYLQYASREPERLRVGEKQTLATSVIASGFPYDKDVNPDNNSDNVARIIPYVRDVRRLGSAAYDISCVAAGLLDGRAVTTHWRSADRLRQLYPGLRVDDDRIFIESGKYWTSAGVTAGIDLALALIERDFGAALSQQVARRLVVFMRRNGDQRQYSQTLRLQDRVAAPFRELVEKMEARLSARWSVDDMADACQMSRRTFQRKFAAHFGVAPTEVLRRLREERAGALESAGKMTRKAVEQHVGPVPKRPRQ